VSLTLRPASLDDAAPCGQICYDAFKTLADAHGFPCDLPAPEVATEFVTIFLSHPGFYGMVAEVDGRIVGSNFIDERCDIVGLGPITVDPANQNGAVGRELMQHALDRVAANGRPGVRLVQAAYHNRSLCLYAKLGFEARAMLSNMQGPALNLKLPGHDVRAATSDDLDTCNDLCGTVHGYDRGGELADAIGQGSATVVEHDGRIGGYATSIGFTGHAVGENNETLMALIGAAPEFGSPGFMLPTGNGELFRWCLEHGLRVVQQMTYMSLGAYDEPTGPYLPSILA
jgi:GNAT superfamily N-acetyltransferase